jgi:NAD(P)-dependent dehydrogenase (short-subunit alcohol dehydrogenase family)
VSDRGDLAIDGHCGAREAREPVSKILITGASSGLGRLMVEALFKGPNSETHGAIGVSGGAVTQDLETAQAAVAAFTP